MRLPRFVRRVSWWAVFRWIAGIVGALLIGIGLSRYFGEDLCGGQDSLSAIVCKLSLLVGGVIVILLILHAFRWDGDSFQWIAFVVCTLAICIGLTLYFWENLRRDPESLSTTVNNVSFVIGGIVAIELALWRSIVGERQTTVAQRQVETAQRDLLNQQFQKGAEMLSSEVLSVRLGGIHALNNLAVEHPEQYHVQVMQQLCAFVRSATGVDGQPTAVWEETLISREEILSRFPNCEDPPTDLTIKNCVARNDIQEAMGAIALCHDKNLAIETTRKYWLNLNGADLRGTDLAVMNLSRAPLTYGGETSVYEMWAIGRYTDMRGAKMDDANLLATKLSRVDLSGATGLTKDSLSLAKADQGREPKLDKAIDAKTGKLLVWDEKICEDE